ncbi:MAG TPA: terminase family protein [Bradyrhizobium sp.]|nr:terminase family protein [Bradyrhizobium sp.]
MTSWQHTLPQQRPRSKMAADWAKILRQEQARRAIDADRAREVYLTQAERRTRLYRLYPETGPLRRELYPKHMEFFALGAVHSERAFIGGNRCITPWTPIEMARSTRLPAEILGERSLDVRSWADGSRCGAQASGVFLKGIEPAFRVHLDNGQAFDCSGAHRVLSVAGWIEFGLLMSLSDGLRLKDRALDYPANCATAHCRDDRAPQSDRDNGQAQPPSPGDARQRALSMIERAGEEEQKFRYIHAYPGIGGPSILDDPDQLADLIGQFEDPISVPGALLTEYERREYQRLVAELGPLAAEASGGDLDRSSWQPDCRLFFPFRHIPLIGGNRIVCAEALGFQPILDIEVYGTHCYETGGVIHHNTGKSFCIGYEGTCHLIGWYPDWWTGRRFNRPVIGWAAGEDAKAVRESLQPTLCGPAEARGTGLIPGEMILRSPTRSGIPDAIDFVEVNHSSGGRSRLVFKAYEQGRESFQASRIDFALLDEEPPLHIYTETLTRTLSTVPGEANGLVLCAFTPLKGVSETVLQFLPGGAYPATEELRKQAWGW